MPRVTRWIFFTATAVVSSLSGRKDAGRDGCVKASGSGDSEMAGGASCATETDSGFGSTRGSGFFSDEGRRRLSEVREFCKNDRAGLRNEGLPLRGTDRWGRFLDLDSKNRLRCSVDRKSKPAEIRIPMKVNAIEMSRTLINFMGPSRQRAWICPLNFNLKSPAVNAKTPPVLHISEKETGIGPANVNAAARRGNGSREKLSCAFCIGRKGAERKAPEFAVRDWPVKAG